MILGADFRRWVLFLLMAVMALWVSSVPSAAAPSGERWYRASLDEGETQGFRWAVGANVPKHEPLNRICVLAGFLAPRDPDVPYAEGDNVSVCGSLTIPASSVTTTAALGQSGSRLVATLYRPVVRKVALLLGTGERKVVEPVAPRIPNRGRNGIPSFRYSVIVLNGGACIRQSTTFDRNGNVLGREGEPCAG